MRVLNKCALRSISIGVLAVIGIIFLVTIIFTNRKIGFQGSEFAKDGKLSLMNSNVCSEPIYLNGMWETFEEVVCKTPQEVQALGEASGYTSFPVAGTTQASKDATYRLRFSVPNQEGLTLFIPNFYQSADVYFNGRLLSRLEDGNPWLPNSTIESIIPLEGYIQDSEWQELVITDDFSNQSATLHKRPVVIGTMKNISALAIASSSNELFLFGILFIILINGYVFMLFRPSHKIISLMTLFDTMILMRSVVSMTYVASFARDIFPSIIVSDKLSSSLGLFFLMIGGVLGCKLSGEIFDPMGKAPKWLIKPCPWIYGAFAIIFPCNLTFFESFGKYMLYLVYVYTFFGIFMQYRVCWNSRKRRTYNAMQMIKTIYVGCLLFIDIILWDSGTNLQLLFYFYALFFVLHIVVRLYDSNESYAEVEALNFGLEDTVKQRTVELSEANKILSELSIRDPLTNIFNRLYFERAAESAVSSFTTLSPIHLSILDLDLFKHINDTYGHDAGDEQLKAMTKLVGEIIGDEAVFARLGGEEFVLFFVGKETREVMSYIERVHAAIEADARINTEHTTASFGVSDLRLGDTIKDLLKNADVALYQAKANGRNTIVTSFEYERNNACIKAD